MTQRSPWRFLVVLLGVVALLGLVACGNDDDDDGATDTGTGQVDDDGDVGAGEPDDPAAADSEIRENVNTLFVSLGAAGTAETEANKELARQLVIDLIEDGEQFREGVIAVEALAAGLTVEMKTVTFTSDTEADITYDLLINGDPVLPDAMGKVVLTDDTWKLSAETWAALQALADTGADGEPGR